MGVLAAVFPDAGRIALDVAGIERRVIERRREQQRQPIVSADELLIHRRHRAGGARRVRGTRDHRPGLRDRIDPAFAAGSRSQRRAVIVIAAPVPAAIPGLPLDRGPQRGRVGPPRPGAVRFTAGLCDRCEFLQGGIEEPGQPNTFARAALADPAHAVVPVAGSDQRQAVRAGRQGVVEAERAMFEQGGRARGNRRLKIVLVLMLSEYGPSKKGTASSSTA